MTEWRRELAGDRQNAWVTEYDSEIGLFQWSIEDNTCGRVVSGGYADSLADAFAEADAALAEGASA